MTTRLGRELSVSQDTVVDGRAVEASRRLAGALDPAVIDALLADAQASGTPIDGVDGLLNRMTKAVIERALQVEMTHELGYERGDPAGAGSGNSRNGFSVKTISTPNGPVTINVPRDRNGSVEPKIVPKHARRLDQIDEMILSLYSRGMTTRDSEAHLREVYGVNASRELISNVTDVVADEVELWRHRPVDEVYPMVYVEGIRIKVRDQGVVTVTVAHLVMGIDVEGRTHALGIWIAEAEGATLWLSVLTEGASSGAA
jgi:transposase-like protein